MGKLKEKLKPEKLSATFLAYILAYFMCMMTGFCMIMFFRELMYQIGILTRYGLGELGNVASALLFSRSNSSLHVNKFGRVHIYWNARFSCADAFL